MMLLWSRQIPKEGEILMKVPKLALIALFVLCITVMPCFAKTQKKLTPDVLPKIGTRVSGNECWGVLKDGSEVVVAEVNIIVNGKPQSVRHSVIANKGSQLAYLGNTPFIKGRVQFTAMVAFDTRLSIGIRGKLVPGSFKQVKLRSFDEGSSCRIQFAQIIEGKKIVMEIALEGFTKYTAFGDNLPISPIPINPSTGMSYSPQAPLSTTKWETIIWLNPPTGNVEWTKLRKYEAQKKKDSKHPVH